MQQLSDEELVAKFLEGEGAAGSQWLNELFGRYHSRVATWCYRFTGDREAAGDLAQDIFLRAYRNLNAFRGDSKFSTWLYTISKNHCVNEMKARSARLEQSTHAPEFDIEDESQQSALAALEQQESSRWVKDLIEETLDATEKKVMVLHYAEDITLDTLTRLLGLTNPSGARAYVVSAKRKLSAAVERWKAREKRGRR
jgi:RNA polymerase sigma-70 factor, ECF subfamily